MEWLLKGGLLGRIKAVLSSFVLLFFISSAVSASLIEPLLVETYLYADTISEDLDGNQINFSDYYYFDSFSAASEVNVFSLSTTIENDLQSEYWESLYAEMSSTFTLSSAYKHSQSISLSFDYVTNGFSAATFYLESLVDGMLSDLTGDSVSRTYSLLLNPGDSVTFKWFYEIVGAGDGFFLDTSSVLTLTDITVLPLVAPVDEPSTLWLLAFGIAAFYFRRSQSSRLKK